jgi:hypothetical protein
MNPNLVVGLICAAAVLIFVFERLRVSIPPEVLKEYKELADKLEHMIPAQYIPFLTATAQAAKPIALRVEQTAIREAKALIRAYAEQTNTPIDDNLCEWLDSLEKEKAP